MPVFFCTFPGEASQGGESNQTPKDTYLQFRGLVMTKQYDKAYALLDGNARSEFRTAATVLLRMSMMPTGTLEDLSDFEMFRLLMFSQTPSEFTFISEEINEDTATLRGQVRIPKGSPAQPTKVILKRISGLWVIHSTRVGLLE